MLQAPCIQAPAGEAKCAPRSSDTPASATAAVHSPALPTCNRLSGSFCHGSSGCGIPVTQNSAEQFAGGCTR